MPTHRSKSQRCIHVIDGALFTGADQLWAQTRAAFARAQDATRWMQTSAQLPHPNIKLIN